MKNLFQSKDGNLFETKEECIKHENFLKFKQLITKEDLNSIEGLFNKLDQSKVLNLDKINYFNRNQWWDNLSNEWKDIFKYQFGKNLTENELIDEIFNATKLNLYDDKITDLEPLSGLTKLTHLNLYNNKITDLEPLRDLINLTHLDLYNNQITNLKILKSLPNLEIKL